MKWQLLSCYLELISFTHCDFQLFFLFSCTNKFFIEASSELNFISHNHFRCQNQFFRHQGDWVLGNCPVCSYITSSCMILHYTCYLHADIYSEVEHSLEISRLLQRLAERVREEEQLTEELLALQGALQLLLSGASMGETDRVDNLVDSSTMQPSLSAKSNFVVNIT